MIISLNKTSTLKTMLLVTYVFILTQPLTASKHFVYLLSLTKFWINLWYGFWALPSGVKCWDCFPKMILLTHHIVAHRYGPSSHSWNTNIQACIFKYMYTYKWLIIWDMPSICAYVFAYIHVNYVYLFVKWILRKYFIITLSSIDGGLLVNISFFKVADMHRRRRTLYWHRLNKGFSSRTFEGWRLQWS